MHRISYLKTAAGLLAVALMSAPLAAAQGPAKTEAKPAFTPRYVERFMLLYDVNGDGKVTVGEINADQARIFGAMDVDGDAAMSEAEMKRRGRTLQIFRTTSLFDLLDTNGDGKLSVAEIQAPSKRWFKRYDKNGDGVMEASEIPDRRHGRRGPRRGRR